MIFARDPEQKTPWLKQYHEILSEGWEANPLPEKPPKKKRGRTAKTKSQNLLTRLGDFEESVLAFLHDINVPFTNNLAEQDIRMIKVRVKISGCFRTVQGAEHFARIRSYLKFPENKNGFSGIVSHMRIAINNRFSISMPE